MVKFKRLKTPSARFKDRKTYSSSLLKVYLKAPRGTLKSGVRVAARNELRRRKR